MIMVIQNLLLVSIDRLCQISNVVFQRVLSLADAGTDSPLQGRRRSRVCGFRGVACLTQCILSLTQVLSGQMHTLVHVHQSLLTPVQPFRDKKPPLCSLQRQVVGLSFLLYWPFQVYAFTQRGEDSNYTSQLRTMDFSKLCCRGGL